MDVSQDDVFDQDGEDLAAAGRGVPRRSLSSRAWWEATVVLCLRQALHASLPVVLVLAAPGRVLRWAELVALTGAVGVTFGAALLRALQGAQDTTPLGMVARSVAGVLLGLGVTDLASLASVNWRAACTAACLAGVLALVHVRVDPPSRPVPVGLVGRVPLGAS